MGTQAKVRRTRTPGIREIFNVLVESGIQKNVPHCGIQDSWFWNLEYTAEYSSRNPEPTNDWNPESKFHSHRLKPSDWNPAEFKIILDSLATLTFRKFFMKWGKVKRTFGLKRQTGKL